MFLHDLIFYNLNLISILGETSLAFITQFYKFLLQIRIHAQDNIK
jgi:hypothetical protein